MHTHNKTVTITGIKTAGLAEGEFIGLASTFGNTDLQGDRVLPGAFAKSVEAIKAGAVVPIAWEHDTGNPLNLVGEIKAAAETAEGLEIHAKLDTDTERGAAAYRAVKGRRVGSLSIGYGIRHATKAADGVRELTDLDLREVSLVARPANTSAVITASKSAADEPGTASAPSLIQAARQALAKASGDDAPPAADESPLADTAKPLGDRFVALLEQCLADARALIETAEQEGRDLTEEEGAAVAKSLTKADWAKSEITAWAKNSPEARYGVQYMRDVIGGHKGVKVTPADFETLWGNAEQAFKSFAIPAHLAEILGDIPTNTKAEEATIVTAATKFLTLGSGRKAAAETIANAMTGSGDPAGGYFTGTGGMASGTKALTSSGQTTTDVPMAPTVIPAGRAATSILDVISTERRSTPVYAYMRQNARDLNAAAVAEGGTKPTSTVGVETIENRMSVVAHLSEAIDKFVLADARGLVRFVQDELVYGLDLAIQEQVLTADGTGANQTGILETSGVQVQAFDTSALASIRKAMTKAEAQGYALGAVVMSPTDWEAIELTATSDDAVAFRGVPIDLAERKVWGLRVVLSTALPAKTALALDPSAVSIDTVGGVDVEWSTESGALFSKNQVQARVETRIGVSVYAPAAIYKIGTAA